MLVLHILAQHGLESLTLPLWLTLSSALSALALSSSSLLLLLSVLLSDLLLYFILTIVGSTIITVASTSIIVAGAEGVCEYQQGGHITDNSLPQVGTSGPVRLPQAVACAHSVPVTADPQPHQLYSPHQGMSHESASALMQATTSYAFMSALTCISCHG